MTDKKTANPFDGAEAEKIDLGSAYWKLDKLGCWFVGFYKGNSEGEDNYGKLTLTHEFECVEIGLTEENKQEKGEDIWIGRSKASVAGKVFDAQLSKMKFGDLVGVFFSNEVASKTAGNHPAKAIDAILLNTHKKWGATYDARQKQDAEVAENIPFM